MVNKASKENDTGPISTHQKDQTNEGTYRSIQEIVDEFDSGMRTEADLWGEIYGPLRRLVGPYLIVLTEGISSFDEDDLMVETYKRASAGLAGKKGPFVAWFRAIARNCAIDRRRKEQARMKRDEGYQESRNLVTSGIAVRDIDLDQVLDRVRGRLSERDFEIGMAWFLHPEEVTLKELAQRHGVSAARISQITRQFAETVKETIKNSNAQ